MRRSDLVHKLAVKYPHLLRADVELIVETIFSQITDAMSCGGRVELRGFGAFSVREREERMGHNPRNGEKVYVPAKKVPFFRTGKLLNERLNA